MPRSPSAAARSCPALRSISSSQGSTVILGEAWFRQGGRTPALSGDARFQAITLPFADDLFATVPVLGPTYSERLISGHFLLTYFAFAHGADHLVGSLPHPLRVAPARRR